jgi:DNA topoisomerase-1
VGAQTAEVLGNTLAICKRHYIHPRVLEAFAAGKLENVRAARAKRNGMSRIEVALAKFLSGG